MSRNSQLLLLFLIISLLLSCVENTKTKRIIKEYYSSGEILREYYINSQNQKHGLFKEYYKSGKIKALFNYEKDTLNGEQKEYYNNGQLKALAYYVKSFPDSITKWYYPDGSLKSESFRLKSKLFGIQKEFYPNGAEKSLHFMKNDTDQLFSFDFNDMSEIVSHSKKFIYCLYEKDSISVLDTAKLVFYTLVPPLHKEKVFLIEKKKNKYYIRKPAFLDTINNNKGVLVLKTFKEPGEYEIGLVVELRNRVLNTEIMDSFFISFKVK